MKFEIKNRYSREIQFTAEIEAAKGVSLSVTPGLAVGADLSDASLIGASNITIDVPIIDCIDAKILAAIELGGTLNMDIWHGKDGACGTTHCRAGWATHLAGEQGKELEKEFGPQRAAAMIYRASGPGVPAPWFFASNEAARVDIRKCAEEQTTALSKEGSVDGAA